MLYILSCLLFLSILGIGLYYRLYSLIFVEEQTMLLKRDASVVLLKVIKLNTKYVKKYKNASKCIVYSVCACVCVYEMGRDKEMCRLFYNILFKELIKVYVRWGSSQKR